MKPILFSLGPFIFYSYHMMIALGASVSFMIALRRAQKDAFPSPTEVLDGTLLMLLTGFWGARFLYVFHHADWYSAHPLQILAMPEGGLTMYGAVFALIPALLLYGWVKKIPLLKGLDFVFPFLPLTFAFVRIGCFLNGCCFGIESHLPWALKFPNSTGLVHPTQLYDSAIHFLLFLFLYHRYPKKRFDGEIVALYFVLYSFARFTLEFLRVDDHPLWTPLTFNQYLSLNLLILGSVLYICFAKLRKTEARRSSPLKHSAL